MNDESVNPRESAIAHRWRDQLGTVWLPACPRGVEWRIAYKSNFIGFLWTIGHKANADGSNRVPPGADWLYGATGASKNQIRSYWEAAQALGIIKLRYSAGERYVTGYTLLMAPAYLLNWKAARAELRRESSAVQREERKSQRHRNAMIAQAREAIHDRRESVATDSPETAVVESLPKDSPSSPDDPSESVAKDSASPYQHEASPYLRKQPGTPGLYHDVADVVLQPEALRARAEDEMELPDPAEHAEQRWSGYWAAERRLITEDEWEILPTRPSPMKSVV